MKVRWTENAIDHLANIYEYMHPKEKPTTIPLSLLAYARPLLLLITPRSIIS